SVELSTGSAHSMRTTGHPRDFLQRPAAHAQHNSARRVAGCADRSDSVAGGRWAAAVNAANGPIRSTPRPANSLPDLGSDRHRSRPLMFPLNRLVHFLAMHRNLRRGFDPQPHLVAANVDDGDLDIVADENAFIALT